jgi:NADH:ubiquinone oxidoreductase subunit F (NADH-binding)
MVTLATDTGLLAGPALEAGAESIAGHVARLGPLPGSRHRADLIRQLDDAGIVGRGGAGFPVGRKWRAVAERSAGHAALVVNGAEGEPASLKDRSLMAARPHLVIDGALLAADAVGAEAIIFYVGSRHRRAASALRRAIAERKPEFRQRVDLVEAPVGYVSGEETAAIHYLEEGIAKPTSTPPRPFERGLWGRPTLVQNVESLAAAALLARGAQGRGTTLLTVSGVVHRPGVQEIELGTRVADVVHAAGGLREPAQAMLLGGYFGSWVSFEEAPNLPLDPGILSGAGLGLGCGVMSFLPADVCGVEATAQVMSYLASQSAGQCGPCIFGLNAIAEAVARLARRAPRGDDLERVTRWGGQLAGRGACKHPDGAVGLLRSALRVFGDEFASHQRYGVCGRTAALRGAA